MNKLFPKNKYAWIRPLEEDQKVGNLFVPGNVSNSYRIAEVLGIDDCDEAKGIGVGQRVLYDTLGAVSHRIGNATYVTVKVLNILAVVETAEEGV